MSRELDAKVANLVMGWTADFSGGNPVWRNHAGVVVHTKIGFAPSTDPACDHEVLKHVSENWAEHEPTIDRMDKFVSALGEMWKARDCEPLWYGGQLALVRFYTPGDWSIAALKAIGEA